MTAHRASMCSCPDTKFRLDLEIAGISLSVQSFQEWADEKAFLPFVKTVERPDYSVVFCETGELPRIPETVIYEGDCYRVHPDGKGGYLRSFFDAPRDYTPYAVARYDHENGLIEIDCLPKGFHCVSEIHNSFFHIGFESILANCNRLCLHAACVETELGGILFSGRSGSGKTTQADLWHKHRGGKHINGDRPILSKDGGSWLAWGSPYAGSSGCHVNEKCRVSSVVMVQQSPVCSLQRLKPAEAFREVWSGLTVHSWDRAFVEKAFDLASDFVSSVPVFTFCCTPDLFAVEYLEQELRKELCK